MLILISADPSAVERVGTTSDIYQVPGDKGVWESEGKGELPGTHYPQYNRQSLPEPARSFQILANRSCQILPNEILSDPIADRSCSILPNPARRVLET